MGIWKHIAVAVALLVALAVLACVPEYPEELEPTPKAGVLAAALGAAYEGNPVRWERDIRGNQVRFWGKVASIKADGSVSFRYTDLPPDAIGLTCSFQDLNQVAALRRGSKIIVDGTVDRVSLTRYGNAKRAYLVRCVLAS